MGFVLGLGFGLGFVQVGVGVKLGLDCGLVRLGLVLALGPHVAVAAPPGGVIPRQYLYSFTEVERRVRFLLEPRCGK